jgi:hypothetical protein
VQRRWVQLVAVCAVGWQLSASTALAGPWTREPGRWYVKLAQGLFRAEGFRDSSGAFVQDTTYTGLSTSLYGELGLIERLHGQLYLPFVVGINEFDRDAPVRLATPCAEGRLASSTSRRSLGDAQLAAQWHPALLAVPHAVRAVAKLPLYDLTQPGGPCGPLYPQPGDGQLDFDLWLSAGDSLAGGELFVFVEAGHRFRSELYLGEDVGQRFGDTFLSFAQAGWRFGRGAFLMLNLNLALPYGADAVTRGWFTLGPSVFFPVGRGVALELAADATPWARNSGAGQADSLYWTSLTLGVSHTR